MVGVDDLISEVRRYYGPCEGNMYSEECHPHTRFFLLFSGGRDSALATYVFLEALSSEPDLEFHVVYVDHEVDFPWMRLLAYRSLAFFSSQYGVGVHVVMPSERFWDFVFRRRYLFPTPEKRWYVRHLVVKPLREFFNKYLREDSLNYDAVVMGSRYEDASSKRIRPVEGVLNWGTHNVTGLHAVFPIAGLSTEQVRSLVAETPLSAYNDYYPLRYGSKPGCWVYLSDSTFAYLRFAASAGLPASVELEDYVSTVARMQADESNLGLRRRRWNDVALDLLRERTVDLYTVLSDMYPGLYTSDDVNYIRTVRLISESSGESILS